ncbi:hypothetical protein RhiirA1_466912 [Rhizophagus irregularis]|uniref:FAR1 domain-containing protein n=3 Tax=Rhizophagus irregularis TaxID=588596 RepID=A0A2N0RD16_9GLOM|nr:hypothetical protein RhiirA1_466912 [Rhizophagus irregularis]CAB4487122.1 unnamed protein product [Rhizophagus irregularis]CAB5181865.1 unnamed protein product [Rhizophagus irregularis]
MNIYPVEFNPIYINDMQDIKGVEYINIDKENNDTLISTVYSGPQYPAVKSEDIPKDTKDEVDNYFDEYGARNRFAIIKYKMDQNSKGQVYKRTLVCEFSGKYKSKKMAEVALKETQQNTKTKKLNCPWHINLSFPDQATQIGVTTFINQHNHILVPKTQEFATKYRLFTDEALNEISLMTKHGNLTLTVQKNLLKA